MAAGRAAAQGGDGKPATGADDVTRLKTENATLRSQLAAVTLRADRADQRYANFKAKYDSEVPRYAAEIKGLKSQLEAARSGGNAGSGGGAAPAVGKLANEDALVTKYGQAWVDDMKSIAGTIAQGSVDEKLRGLAPPADGGARRQPAGNAGNEEFDDSPDQGLIDRYEAQLTALVPTWEAQNNDPVFNAWLQQRDPMAGVARQTLLVRHHRAMDAEKVAEIFRAFTDKREIGAAQSAAPNLSPPEGASEQDKARLDAGHGKVWARAEISQFYKDCALGKKYAGTEGAAERARMEKDIFAAQKEGRVK